MVVVVVVVVVVVGGMGMGMRRAVNVISDGLGSQCCPKRSGDEMEEEEAQRTGRCEFF